MSLRIAHLSDPHFSCVSFSPSQFLSKRWLGNLNLILFRSKAYQTTHLQKLPELLTKLDVEFVMITGDFTQTSLDEEFQKGASFAHSFKEEVYTLPGNHDMYTKRSEKEQTYYNYFPSKALQTTRVEKKLLKEGWWLVGLDCARANSLLLSNGVFTPEMDAVLDQTLRSIPATDRVIIANHFPLFPSGRASHDTERGEALQEVLKKYPNVVLYLHGHDHEPYIIDHQNEGHPLVLNAGSCAHQPDGTFYLIELERESCLVERLLFTKKNDELFWSIDLQKHYEFLTLS
ncbi:MAG: 3',5'-cyclic adenosine monophosphate phosphodiesterase CpdA [Chlamydiales bacterium]|nr:3',5'-cyclic adenosine monophosphate phosphodiesterase CpdA [Chlamydiales bacterium]MCH9619855.1 3',5'-cyclic adenosine monophosphate phosphodiesterase CpdA [Chlamydiales bacterium]MCH9622718.1 3',5'-cyclic adenosine monophosphate phosphodiesterase CpdA [Chlamydiales bacterium]